MRVWSDSLAGVAGLEWKPVEVKPYGNHVGEYVDEGTVPTTAPYKRVLDFRPVRGKLSITISGTPATLIEWGTAPSGTGVVAVDWVGGQLEFAAADAGAAVVATMSEHYGTVVDSGLLNSLQSELAAAQAAIQAGNVYTVGPTGSGAQYETVQAALDAIPNIGEGREAGEWAVVRVLPGRYLTTAQFGGIHVFKEYVSFEGDNRDLCIIEKARVDADGGIGEFPGVDPFAVDASHIRISGLTIRNTATNWPGVGMALTINAVGGRGRLDQGFTHVLRSNIIVRDCNIVSAGGRDSIFVMNRVDNFLMEGCYIEGSSDIVALCSGTLRDCHIHCIEGGANPHACTWLEQGWYEGAIRDEITFERCTFTGVGSVIAFNVTRGLTTAVDCVVHGAGSFLHNSYGEVGVSRTLRTRGCTAANFLGPSNAQATVVVEELKTSGVATLSDALTGYIPKSTLTAKGSILTASAASTPAELAVGPDGSLMMADSTAPTGQRWVQRGVVWQTLEDSATLNGSVSTEQDFSQTFTIPANALVAGSVWRIVIDGVTKGNGTAETCTLKLYLGSTVILNTGARSTQNTNFGGSLRLPAMLIVRSAGATGSVVGLSDGNHGVYWYGDIVRPATHTINTTGTLVLKATAQWSGANAANEARIISARLERLA